MMSRPIEVEAKFWKEDFLEMAKKEPKAKVYIRLLALHHVQEKKSYSQISQLLKVSTRSIQGWVKRYALKGIEGLQSQTGQGRKHALTEKEAARFKEVFLETQELKAGGRLTGEDARQLLEQLFSRTYSLKTAYRTLHRVGLSWITGRDIHPDCNAQEQEEFKKTLTSW